MSLVHNESGTRWVWYTMSLVHNESGTRWVWYTMGLVHSGPGTQCAWYTMGLRYNLTMGLVHNKSGHNGPGTQWGLRHNLISIMGNNLFVPKLSIHLFGLLPFVYLIVCFPSRKLRLARKPSNTFPENQNLWTTSFFLSRAGVYVFVCVCVCVCV